MSDLVAELQLRFGVQAAQPTFALALDDRDALLNSPINVQDVRVFNWNWSEDEFAAFYKDLELLKVMSNGVQHIRLYAETNLGVELFATELPVALKGIDRINFNPNFPSGSDIANEFNRRLLSFQDVTKLPGVTVTQIRPPQPVPPTVEYIGQKNDLIMEVIKFQNQRVAYQEYNYARGGFETAYASSFITNDGRTIDRPVWVPDLGGAFVLKEPATGAVVIRYLVQYHLYKVNYGMASGIEFPHLQLAWLRGDISTFPMPPVTVLAIAPNDGQIAEASFEKVVYPNGATLASWSTKGFEEAQQSAATFFSEKTRQVVTRRITDPADENNFIDVEDTKSITLFDKDGRPFTYRFAG